MTTSRTVSKHVPQHHYALLPISPLSPSPEVLSIDQATLLQILQKQLSEWFGTAGGVNSNETEIVQIQPPHSGLPGEGDSNPGDREVILRFPRSQVLSFACSYYSSCFVLTILLTLFSIASQLLTALPLLNSSPYRFRLVNDSNDLSRFAGFAGKGKSGFNDWKAELLVDSE